MPRRVKNPAPENSATQKAWIAVQFWTQSAGDKWKSARMVRLLGVFVRVCYG